MRQEPGHKSREPRHARVAGAIWMLAVGASLACNPTATRDSGAEPPPEPDPEQTREVDSESIPGSYRLLKAAGAIQFPFDVFRGDIRFRAEINGHEVYLLLDDGFMWDPLLFWGGPDVDALGLVASGETMVGEAGDDDAIASTTASGITLGLPGVEFIDQTAVITPASSGTSTMWAGSVGQVSATLFKHFVVDINFDSMLITLIEPAEFEYAGQGSAVPWKPMPVGAWSIPGTLILADGREISMELMMDLGLNRQAQIVQTGEDRLTAPENALPGRLGFDIQRQELLGLYGRLPGIQIGGFRVEEVIVGFIAEDQGDQAFHEVMIGLGLLSRFNLVFDHSNRRLFVEPNSSFADAFEHDMSGMELRKSRDGNYDVVRIHPDSPAAETGLEVGDVVLRINDRAAPDWDTWSLAPLLRREGETVHLTVRRAERQLLISLRLRRLI